MYRCLKQAKITQSVIMVECGREYVLSWPGHAAYVTDRFSGLLARQMLVDVTLICEEQQLRVHKLVLASCSLYFEEIFAQDLGVEPVILLRDLNFSILKAMVEFMYCGETKVSHTHLPSLLAAARLFKVKELESLVEKMVGSSSQDHNDNNEEYISKDTSRTNGLINGDDHGIRVSFSNKHNNNNQSSFGATESSDSESEQNYLEENISDSPNERCLYEESILNSKTISYSPLHRNGEVIKDNSSRQKHTLREKSVDSVSDSSSTLDSEHCGKNVESTLYERCCNFVNNGYAKNEDHSQIYISSELQDNEINRVGQCSKVYTHKKRKINGDNTSKRHTHFENALPQPLTPNRIDLIDDSSNDETPVTLKTNLDSESSDYVLSFNSESIQSIVGCSLNDYCPSNTFELLNARTHLVAGGDKKDNVEVEADRTPVLRRSVRLNQQESDEPVIPKLRSKLRDDKKSRSSSDMKLFSRTKRKNKELERRVPNVKVIFSTQSGRKNHSRPLRKTSKLSSKCNGTKNHFSKNEKEMGKPKTAEKLTNPTNLEKLEATETQHTNESIKPSSSDSVNRALWGDMSDIAEDNEGNKELLEYSTSAEIPYAVGLLPLRAALEKMQATLDHQPRKTRSSVASTKQESNGLKRKNSPSQEVPSIPKKQNTIDSVVDENQSAVCHLQIRTSSQCSRPRKRSLSDGAANLGQTAPAISGRP